MMRFFGEPESVGSDAIQSTRAAAASVRVTSQLPEPSPVSGSPAHAEPFDFRWLTATVTTSSVPFSRNVWATAGRLRVVSKRGSTVSSRTSWSPTGVTVPGL